MKYVPPFLLILSGFIGCGDDADTSTTCDPTQCQGCCNTRGQCVEGFSDKACGKEGETCTKCEEGASCYLGQCSTLPCGPTACPTGCCHGNLCLAGDALGACGRGGMPCFICDSNQLCQSGMCVDQPCDAQTCPDGCCFNGVCMPGTNRAVCGHSGKACESCKDGVQCIDEQCQVVACGPSSCPGCCTSKGNCEGGEGEGYCGKGGKACVSCAEKQTCVSGSCLQAIKECNATTCPDGCCNSQGNCIEQSTKSTCGIHGEACTPCGSNEECVAGKCTCTVNSCSGCCEGNQCKPGDRNDLCGEGGQSCQICSATDQCVNGVCSNTCSWSTCPTGCCLGGVCQVGLGHEACGVNGYACEGCDLEEDCIKGTCNLPLVCNATSCGSGCCVDGFCLPGTAQQTCGRQGDVCTKCAFFEKCQGGGCVFEPAFKWKVILVRAEIAKDPQLPDKWDPNTLYPEPDVFVEMTVGTQTKTSKIVADNFSPVFDELLLTETFQSLMGLIKVKVWDWDPVGSNDLIDSCELIFFESDFKGGKSTKYYCGAGLDLKLIEFRFEPAAAP
jgi:hypothetical protein